MKKRITKRTRLIQKRRKRRLLYLLILIGFLVLVYAGLGWGLTQPRALIATIEVRGNEHVASGILVNTVQQGLAVTRGLLLYGGTVMTYDDDAIVSNLLHIHPRLESATLTMKRLDALELRVTERAAAAQWCNDTPDLEASLLSCYLLDKDGFVFENVARGPLTTLVTYSGDLSGDVIGQRLLHGEFAALHSFVIALRELGISVTEVVLMGDEVEIVSAQHPLLKINRDDKLQRTLSYIDITLVSKEYAALSTKEEGVAYIDLRFGNRVYYK